MRGRLRYNEKSLAMWVRLGASIPLFACVLCLPAQGRSTVNFLPAIRDQIERAEREAKAHPDDAKAAGVLAMTLHAYEQYDAAARSYSRAYALDPRAFDWPYLLGAVDMQQGDFDGAVKAFRSALQIRPGDLAAELRLGQSLAAAARWDEAGEVYRRILESHPDCPQAWYGLGRAQAGKGDRAAAAQSYSRACDLFPQYSAAHLALAGELRRLGKPAEAGQHAVAYSKNSSAEPPLADPLLRRVRELNQGAQAHMQRGIELEKLGKLDEAIREHEAALATDPDNIQVRVNLISLYGRAGDPARAVEEFEAATRLSPGRSDAWYNYGVLLFGQHKYADAGQAFRRALEINPYYAEAHNNLGAVYEQDGRLDEAGKEFSDAIASRPDYPLARFHLARILVIHGRHDEAIQQLLKALKPESDQTALYLYALGAAYARTGDRAHAVEYYGQAHNAAAARNQSQLLASIDRDLKLLSGGR